MPHITAQNLSVCYPVVNMARKGVIRTQESGRDTSWGKIIIGRRPKVIALDNISLYLKQGDRVAVMGKNGSGKTTLLQTLGGIIIPNEGELDVRGTASGIFNLRQGLKMERSGRKNIILRGLALGKTRTEIMEKQEEIEGFSELGEFLDLPMSTYSSGMVMRLIFAVVMAFEPDIMLLDEWIGTADTAFRDKAMKRVREFTRNDRIFMLASHNPKLLEETCDTAILMNNGKIIEHGALKAVQKEYRALIKNAA